MTFTTPQIGSSAELHHALGHYRRMGEVVATHHLVATSCAESDLNTRVV